MTEQSLPSPYRGVKILHDPVRNKGTAYTEAERDHLQLRGLLPPRVHSLAEQELRVLHNVRAKATDLERYLYLVSLQDCNETLFYRVLTQHIEELMPIVYTPTVGRACQEFQHIFRQSRGFYVSLEDRGRIRTMLENWPHKEAKVIVVTDGERILGLGDLGADGMGIPIGKLALYTACAGIPPTQCLPVMLDMGTDNEPLRRDPLYNGLAQRRLRGDAYEELVEEFITAAQDAFPGALIQLEDFGTRNAFSLLQRYRDRVCLFDDDVQGTGAVALAGVLAALRLTGDRLRDQRFLFMGAGEAAVGIADTITAGLLEEGLSVEEAQEHCWLFDSRGLVVRERSDVAEHKRNYAHDHAQINAFVEAVRVLQPTAIIGACAQPGLFDEQVVRTMASINRRPLIFALSNPTSKAECTAEQAYGWTEGRAIFASGSPFAPVQVGEDTFVPGQGNNAYIFPGVGLGVVVSGARAVTDEMFLAAAHALADQVWESDLQRGRVYPALDRIRSVSARIAHDVATVAWDRRLTDRQRPEDLSAAIHDYMYEPEYPDFA